MLKKVFQFIKPFLLAGVFVFVLKVTGLIGSVSYLTQSAVIKTGLLNASDSRLTEAEDFDYNFSLQDLSGQRVAFEGFKGKVAFINLWATWCGPCRAEMPTIEALFADYQREDIAFVMLSLDKNGDQKKVINYIAKGAFSFPVFMPYGNLAQQLQVPYIPTTLVVSKEGKIIYKHQGTANYNTSRFRKLLDQEIAK